jgi:hypothetical protein
MVLIVVLSAWKKSIANIPIALLTTRIEVNRNSKFQAVG